MPGWIWASPEQTGGILAVVRCLPDCCSAIGLVSCSIRAATRVPTHAAARCWRPRAIDARRGLPIPPAQIIALGQAHAAAAGNTGVGDEKDRSDRATAAPRRQPAILVVLLGGYAAGFAALRLAKRSAMPMRRDGRPGYSHIGGRTAVTVPRPV